MLEGSPSRTTGGNLWRRKKDGGPKKVFFWKAIHRVVASGVIGAAHRNNEQNVKFNKLCIGKESA